jgi:hypothetical protein
VKPNSHKFENKVALVAWGGIAVLALLHYVFPGQEPASLILSAILWCFLLWRLFLWELRKKAERRRVIAWWERPESHDQIDVVRDVMRS